MDPDLFLRAVDACHYRTDEILQPGFTVEQDAIENVQESVGAKSHLQIVMLVLDTRQTATSLLHQAVACAHQDCCALQCFAMYSA
jgi:hypothetical protein